LILCIIARPKLSAREAGSPRVFLSPFWAGTAHVVQFGPIWIEQQARERAPPMRHLIEDARRDGEQHSEDRLQERTHFDASWGGPATRFLLRDQMPIMLVQQSRSSMLRRSIWPDVFAEPTHTYVYAARRVDQGTDHLRVRQALREDASETGLRPPRTLSQSTSSLLVGLPEATRGQWTATAKSSN
jgi:hypothetical protein